MTTKITPALLKQMGKDIEAALAGVAEKYGVQIAYAGGSYSSDNATLKLKIAVVGEGGEVHSQERSDFRVYAHMFGLEPEWLDKEFRQAGKNYVVVGLKPKSHKYPVLAKCLQDGKTYKFPAGTIKVHCA